METTMAAFLPRHADGRQVFFTGLLIALGAVLYHCILVQPIDHGGDALFKWQVHRQMLALGAIPPQFYENPAHMLRWASNLPVLGVQWLFDSHPSSYFLCPILIAAGNAVWCFVLGRRLGGQAAGILTALAYTAAQTTLHWGTQFLPMSTATFFMLGALWFLLRWMEREHYSDLLACSVMFFVSYGAKVTAIYYVPAICILLVYHVRSKGNSFRDAVPHVGTFLGVLVLLFCIETVLISSFTSISGGRFAGILAGHNPSVWDKDIFAAQDARWYDPLIGIYRDWRPSSKSLLQYIGNFFVYTRHPGKTQSITYYAAFILCVYALRTRKKTYYPAVAIYLSGFFASAYAIVSVFPFVRPERVLFRYHTIFYTLGQMMVISFLLHTRFPLIARYCKWFKDSYVRPLRVVLLLAFFAPLAVEAVKYFPVPNSIIAAADAYDTVQQARGEGRDVFIPVHKWPERTEKLQWKYVAFYSDLKRIPPPYSEETPHIVVNGQRYFRVEEGTTRENPILLDHY